MKFLSLFILSVLLIGSSITAQSQPSVSKAATNGSEISIEIDDPSKPDTANKADNNKNEALLSKAYKSLREDKPKEAIDKYLNPIIADFKVTFNDSNIRVYSARSTAETLLYLFPVAIDDKSVEKNITKVIVVEYFWSEAFFLKGNAYISLGQIEKAKKWLNKAMELSPNNATYMSELGFIYQSKRKFKAALKLYEKAEAAVEYAPENEQSIEKALALRGAGYSLIELGRLEEAEQKYREALKIDPDDNKSKIELQYIEQLREKASKN